MFHVKQNKNKIGDSLNAGFKDPLFKNRLHLSVFSFYVHSLFNNIDRPVVFVCDNNDSAHILYKSLSSIISPGVYFYPEKSKDSAVPGFVGDFDRFRSECVHSIDDVAIRGLFIGTHKSLNEKNIPVKNDSVESVELKRNENLSPDNLTNFLISSGYKKTDTVIDPGYYSTRGEVFDFYPPHKQKPIRVLFDFDSIELLSEFDPSTQLKTKSIDSIKIRNTNTESLHVDYIGFIDLLSDYFKHSVSLCGDYVSLNNGTSIDESFEILSLSKVFKEDRANELKNKIQKHNDVYFVGSESLKNKFSLIENNFSWINGNIHSGFINHKQKIVVVSGAQLFNTGYSTDKWKNTFVENFILSPGDISRLEVGDLLVHKNFGIGKYNGLTTNHNSTSQRESIEIEFSNNTKVYVSLEKMEFIHRYFGSAKKPSLSTIGSKKWDNEIKKTKKSVELVASELLELYANKNKKRSFQYSKNDTLLQPLKNSFPFIETQDQSKAIDDIFQDMRSDKPIDRLVCGDVGFGKTEVAIRATIMAVGSNKQVLFLCPTTILADQHYITCKERLGPIGVEIGLLSRFKTRKEQSELLNLIKNSKIDVIIGTHRLLSDDVFVPNMGLLIVDEEHRFGVNHKEKIRTLKQQVDVLTLTATPIPRTLQQSLVGIRDVSLIQTPPKSRKPIETSVGYFSWDIIHKTISAELNRRGQVYFLHNDIKALPFITKKVKERFPQHSVENIHGQMSSKELEQKILSFFDGGIDVLVCTTIIESGLDVTNANTIIINEAQNLGLSQLYQIRGRVGRGDEQAYCLLLIPNKPLEKNAYRRLKTIEQNTSLGSGYTVSLQDLEIRGAGSLFGYKQSGHLSNVGFELYCEILKGQIEKITGQEKKIRFPEVVFNNHALITESYIPNATQRLDFYNKLSSCDNLKTVQKIQNELVDRFGKMPSESKNLLHIAQLRAIYKNSSVKKLTIQSTGLLLELDNVLPFKSVDDLFDAVGRFDSNNHIGHRFGQTKNGNLTITFSVIGFSQSMALSLEISCLFSVLNDR